MPKQKQGAEQSVEERAEDILLGGLGFGEEAKILRVERTASGFKGVGCFADAEEFEFESEDPLSVLEDWALTILAARH
ncbi:MAG: hypothetical protein QY326_05335 [Bdellovibrionota bacterium]|nr:MAG: hypothetical protein QY326_05335 [Bdellovibrionota bacterium]